MSARKKLNSVHLVRLAGISLFVGLLFQSPFIAIMLGAALAWSAIDDGRIRLDAPQRR